MRLLALWIALTACADSVATDETEVSAEADGKADAATELSVRSGDTTLWVTRHLTVRDGSLVLRGRTSRNLTDGRGFVFDDVYGDFARVSPRVFELAWTLSTARTLTDGVDQFIGLTFAHSATTARVVVRPRLATFSGSSKIYLTAELTPVVVDGLTVYRIAGHTTAANTGVTASAGTVTRVDDTRFTIDFAPDAAYALGDLQIIAAFPTGGVEKHATLGFSVKQLGMTTGDAYEIWPRPTCTTALKGCLAALPDGALDLASCGDAFHVNSCVGQVGVRVDDPSITATLATAATRLAGAHDDAVALAGTDRAASWLAGARTNVATALQGLTGRWYLSVTARTGALNRGLEAGLDRAYARPLELFAPHVAVPGDAAAMRQVAADAVLAELAAMDFVHSEFARSLEQLTHEFRAQHLADIRAFRETIDAEPYPGQPTWDAYLGSWLGAYTEIAIERATGVVTHRLVELD